MLFRITFLSLCARVCLGQRVQVDDEVTFLPSRVEYSLNFTWPIHNVLNLPPSGEVWDNQNSDFVGNGQSATKWLFRLSCTKNKTDNARKMYLALRLETLPQTLKYFYGGAECGIVDNGGQLKNVVRTGKNVLLPSFNLRFDPLIYRDNLIRDAANLIKGSNKTMTVNCSISGLFKEEIIPFNETINGEVVTSAYPSFTRVIEESARVESNGDFTFTVEVEIDDFVKWPLVYHNGNLTFDSLSSNIPMTGFVYQIRTYNPNNSRYPLYLWLESAPKNTSNFKGSLTCGLLDAESKRITGETAILGGPETSPSGFSDYFFSFQYALDYNLVNGNLKVTPYGAMAVRIFCEMTGTFSNFTN